MNDASSPTVALSACCGVETVVSLDGGSASWAGGSATERGFESGAVIIRVTHRDLGETLHPAAPDYSTAAEQPGAKAISRSRAASICAAYPAGLRAARWPRR